MRRILSFLAVCAFVTACADRTYAPVIKESLEIGTLQPLFVATSRGRNESGYLDDTRTTNITYLKTQVSIPPNRDPGKVPVSFRNPDPKKHFTIASERTFEGSGGFKKALRSEFSALPPSKRDLLVFVHGYFNSHADSIFRAAQVKEDLDLPGIQLVYGWPSAGTVLGYNYDRESVMFARDSLEKVLRDLPSSGPRRIVLLGHSMGAMLIMETLRQIEIRTPGWAETHLDGIALLAPDIPLDVFKEQLSRFRKLPQPFLLLVSENDRALQLSERVNNTHRLGQGAAVDQLGDWPVTVVDASGFNDTQGAGHFIVSDSDTVRLLAKKLAGVDRALRDDTTATLQQFAATVVRSRNATRLILMPSAGSR